MESLPVKFHAPRTEPVSKSVTIGDVISLYLTHGVHELGERTMEGRRPVLRDFAVDMGRIAVVDAKAYLLQLWIDGNKAWKSLHTRHRIATSVKAPFTWARRMGIIDVQPFRGVSFPGGPRRRPMRAAEFQGMLRHSKAIFRRVLIFLHFTGCRPGEMAKARWSEVDWERACITLMEHKTARFGRPRIIALHPVAIKLLVWLQRHRPHHEYIFVNTFGRPWVENSALHWRIKEARQGAGISPDVTSYCCRHAFCTNAVLSGLDTATIAELAGHARIETTMRYVHLAGRTDHLHGALNGIKFDKN